MNARAVLESVLLEQEKRFIRCRDGVITYKPQGYGRSFYVTSPIHGGVSVDATELHEILRDMQRELGGKIQTGRPQFNA